MSRRPDLASTKTRDHSIRPCRDSRRQDRRRRSRGVAGSIDRSRATVTPR